MKPVQFIGFPAVPGGLRNSSRCTNSKCGSSECTLKFDSFASSIDVFDMEDWHVAIPSRFKRSKCKESTSSSSLNFLAEQDYIDRGVHRITSKTAWSSAAMETMLSLSQESGVSFFQRFLTGIQ
jgi:hypothetical protein